MTFHMIIHQYILLLGQIAAIAMHLRQITFQCSGTNRHNCLRIWSLYHRACYLFRVQVSLLYKFWRSIKSFMMYSHGLLKPTHKSQIISPFPKQHDVIFTIDTPQIPQWLNMLAICHGARLWWNHLIRKDTYKVAVLNINSCRWKSSIQFSVRFNFFNYISILLAASPKILRVYSAVMAHGIFSRFSISREPIFNDDCAEERIQNRRASVRQRYIKHRVNDLTRDIVSSNLAYSFILWL